MHSAQDYDALEGLNYSTLKHILDSPEEYQESLKRSRRTRHMDLGTAIHCGLLEPERLLREYAFCTLNLSTKAGKSWKADQIKNARHILDKADSIKCQESIAAVRRHAEAAAWLARITAVEVPLVGTIGGRAAKGRLDALAGDVLLGIKTTGRPLRRFVHEAIGFHYTMQWAMYYDLLDSHGRTPSQVIEIAVHTAYPYEVAVWLIPDSVLEHGRREYTRALELLAECERTNSWPGAYPGLTTLELPAYVRDDDDDTLDGLTGLEELQ